MLAKFYGFSGLLFSLLIQSFWQCTDNNLSRADLLACNLLAVASCWADVPVWSCCALSLWTVEALSTRAARLGHPGLFTVAPRGTRAAGLRRWSSKPACQESSMSEKNNSIKFTLASQCPSPLGVGGTLGLLKEIKAGLLPGNVVNHDRATIVQGSICLMCYVWTVGGG